MTSDDTVKRLMDAVARVLVGQQALVEGLLTGLLAGGHVLVEGVPGLAKTTAVRTLAEALGLGFRRVQFTPDLLPGDLVGTPIYRPDEGRFEVQRGPVFTSVLLADEINRAPAKVQSALLEAMEERQVTIGAESLPLPDPFFVMATQNPIELEGTYPLPEAEVDRFMLKLIVDYPAADDEREIVARDLGDPRRIAPVATPDEVRALRDRLRAIHVAESVGDYAVRLVRATREPDSGDASGTRCQGADGASLPLDECLALGASPRASIFLVRAARARAFLDGRDFATPHDVKRVARDVLRHRLLMTYEAEADGIRPDDVIAALLARVDTP